jgi:hypothetical protein
MNEFILNLLGALLIPILTAIGGGIVWVAQKYVVPWIKTNVDLKTLEKVRAIVEIAVKAAAAEGMKHSTWTAADVKQYAIDEVKTRFGIDLTDPKYEFIRKAVVEEYKITLAAIEGTIATELTSTESESAD